METPMPYKWLRCAVCETAIKRPPSELLKYTQTGWPKCCGEVMILLDSTEETLAILVEDTASAPTA